MITNGMNLLGVQTYWQMLIKGLILVLALHTDGRNVVGFFPCTGMHGGKMVFRGDVSNVPFPRQ